MRIVVCVKQVPDNDKIRINPDDNTLVRNAENARLNKNDENAVEQALSIKDINSEEVEVIALTMGPLSAEKILRQVMGMGADRGILLCDRAFGGSDTYATAKVLSHAIKKIGDVNMIITGQKSSDGETGQVPTEMSEMLGIVHSSFVEEVAFDMENKIIVKKRREDSIDTIEMNFPALIAVSEKINNPRNIVINNISEACEKIIEKWTAKDLDLLPEEIGINGSPTIVRNTHIPKKERSAFMVDGITEKEMVANFIDAFAKNANGGSNAN